MKSMVKPGILLVSLLFILAACNKPAPPLQNDDFVHIHSQLNIIIDGENMVVPAGIGLGGDAHQPLHTHETDGIIHLEAYNPTSDYFKLGKFFEIWDKRLTSSCVFDYCTNKGKLTMTVNGQPNNEFGDYVMKDGDKMILEYVSSK